MGQASTKNSEIDEAVITKSVLDNPNELRNGEMREVDMEGHKIIVAKQDDKFYAFGSRCPLDPASESLIDGVLHGKRLRCARHGSVFDIETGDLLEHPGLDSIHSFKVEVEKDKVVVTASKGHLREDCRIRRSARLIPSDKRTIVIIGAGAAGMSCAETLRYEGFIGKIVVVANDKLLRFDRSAEVSKVFYDGVFPLRERKFYNTRDILFRDKEIIQVNAEKNKVHFRDGDEINYYQLLIASGSRPKVATMIPGYDLDGVHPIRSIYDLEIWSTAGEHVVIIGASALGLQVADHLVKETKSVTVVDIEESPFQRYVGKEVGACIKKILEERGVHFHMESAVKRLDGELGRIKRVVLKNGIELDATLCFTCIGDEPCLEFLKDSGIVISEGNRIIVDRQMRTNKKDVFAAGEIIEFPAFHSEDQLINIQHWPLAQQQGRVAGLNMFNKGAELDSVHSFWLKVGDHSLRFVGHGIKHDKTIIKGNVEERKFTAYFIKDEAVLAVVSLGDDNVVSQAAEVFHTREKILLDNIMLDEPTWRKRFERELEKGVENRSDDVISRSNGHGNGCSHNGGIRDSDRRTSTHL